MDTGMSNLCMYLRTYIFLKGIGFVFESIGKIEIPMRSMLLINIAIAMNIHNFKIL